MAGIFILKQLKKKKEEKREREARLRSEILRQNIKNSWGSQETLIHEEAGLELSVRKVLCLSVSQRGADRQEYVLNTKERMDAGSGRDCRIRLDSRHVPDKACRFFEYQGRLYVKSETCQIEIILKRKKTSTIAGEKGIKLCTGDKIIIGPYCLEVEILDVSGKRLPD